MSDHCDDAKINIFCKSQFDDLKSDISDIKKAIVGNGTVGYNVRIDRLEQARNNRSKMEWIVIGCLAVVLINSAWGLAARIISHVENDKQKTVVEGKK